MNPDLRGATVADTEAEEIEEGVTTEAEAAGEDMTTIEAEVDTTKKEAATEVEAAMTKKEEATEVEAEEVTMATAVADLMKMALHGIDQATRSTLTR